jgi:WD40 repeat protein
MAESSRSKQKKRSHLTDQAYVPSKEVAHDASTSPKPIGAPAGLTLLSTLKGHRGWVISVVWSPDGSRLASFAPDDRTVRLWDPTSGTLLHTLDHTDQVTSVVWSPDGSRLASGSDDGTVESYHWHIALHPGRSHK